MQCAETYDYMRDHPYGKHVSSGKLDYILECAQPLALLALWWIDERGTFGYLSVWEEGEMRAIADGDYPLLEHTLVVPVLRAISAIDCVWRVLGKAGMSWREADHMHAEHHSYLLVHAR